MKKPSYLRKGALQPTKRKAGQTNDRDEALSDTEIEKNPRKMTENGPRKDVEASGTNWVHLSLSCDSGIHLGGSPPLTAAVSQVLREVQHE